MVYLLLPWGNSHGWGFCGKSIIRELAKLAEVRAVAFGFDRKNAADELEFRFFRGLLANKEEVDRLQHGNDQHAVLQAIGDHKLTPLGGPMMAPYKVGYTFFEHLVAEEHVERANRYFDIIAAGSSWCADILRAKGHPQAVPVLQGIDPLIFNPAFADKEMFGDRFVVFSGGKFEFRKGQDIVIRAFKVLQDRHRDVLLVTAWFNYWDFSQQSMTASPYIRYQHRQGDHVTVMRQTLGDNGIDLDRVVILPAQANASMARVYQNTDIGLFPNRCEGGTNLVLMEYMACGKPVIASYSSGHKDIVHPENALLLEQLRPLTVRRNQQSCAVWDDPNLDEAIYRLEWAYEHRDELTKLGARAGQDLARLTWRETARQFHRLLSRSDQASPATGPDGPAPAVLGGREPGRARLRPQDVQKLEAFLDRIKQDVYPEPPSELHSSITEKMWKLCTQECLLPPEPRVLDIGCGQGLALRLFRGAGLNAVGIALSAADVQACRDQGFEALEMDQSFLDFPDATFDFVWCRHCLEHSIFPYFTLSEVHRVMKVGAYLYVEVPAPDTACGHQTNRNHYLVAGPSMWVELMQRTGFTVLKQIRLEFRVVAGPDHYWAFILRKS